MSLGRLTRFLAPERGPLAVAAGCMALLAGTTTIYAWLVGPALRLLLTGGEGGLVLDLPFGHRLGPFSREQALAWVPLGLLVVAAVKGVAYFGQFHLMGMVGQRVVARLRRAYLGAVLEKGVGFFAAHQTGDLLSRFTADVAHIERAVTYSTASYLRDSLTVLALLATAFWLDWRMSLVAFVAVPVVALPVARLARKLKRRAKEGQTALGRLTALVQEGLWGLKVIQAYRMEPRELARFDAENARALRAEEKAAKVRSFTPALVEMASVAGLALVLYFAAGAVLEGKIEPERLLSFLATVALLYQPARDLGRVGQFVVLASASAERLFAVIDAPVEVGAGGTTPLPPLSGALELSGVRFAYGNRTVLDGLNLVVKKGESVALVGESGSGKSTAALLAQRLLDPSAGEVRVDGVDVREAPLADVRRQYGLVTQEPLLFSGTVAENIAYGRPAATPEDIARAAALAYADGFIRALPQGYATRIGERGVRLSGGQRQRLALARALCVGAPVLLLDEATSNLDAESEREVNRALDSALADRTALVIAHRASTIRRAGRIVVLKAGRVAEEGTHDELVARGGEYARLQAQLGPA